MMGFKERAFAPLVAVSLEELVPQDHFYRYLQTVLDLSFVYDLVRESYALAGRPSIDPVVFFKLQLVMFFEDIRSERLLLRQVADRLSVRWYVGYVNNRAERSHQPTRQRERTMRRFKSLGQAQRILSAFGPILDHFRPKRHRLTAVDYRALMQGRFLAWNEVTRRKTAA
jgi:transposase